MASAGFLTEPVAESSRAWRLRRALAWLVGAGLLALLAALRAATNAEFAFASFALLPVIWVAWAAGRHHGLAIATLAAGTWVAGDIGSDQQQWSSWIVWANGLVRLLTYGIVAILAARVSSQLLDERARATRDELTGLANRRHFFEVGRLEVERMHRHRRPAAILFLDLDHFKQLNDGLGHAKGDAALWATARALVEAARVTDVVARLGGDEFAVLLPELDLQAASLAAHRLSAAVNGALADFDRVSASVGVAWFAHSVPGIGDMLKAADALMYQAKQQCAGSVLVMNLSDQQGSGS
ncbi:MAG: GGDEF domain-containing protein [Burkholderiaceae bacterium]|nr:GGDEF domain-containing protein [Burkholderiaceae bacterium]